MTPGSTPPRSAVRRLATARFISYAGTAAAATGLSYLIYERTGRETIWLSAALVVTFGTQAVFTPLLGSLGDRFDRRRILIASDLLGAAGFVALMFVSAPAWMLMVAFLTSVAASPFKAVSHAALPNLAGEERLSWANGLMGVGGNVGYLVGPVLGGGFIALLAGNNTPTELRTAGEVVFGLNALSFLLSAFLVASIHGRFREEARSEHAPGEGGMREGASFLLHDRVLLAITVARMILLFGVGVTLVAELPLAQLLGAGAFGYGLFAAMEASGAVLGSLGAGRTLTARREPIALVAGMACMGLALAAIAIAPWFSLVLVLMLVSGFGTGSSNVALYSLIQRCTPDRLRSRVMSIGEGAVLAVFTISFLLGTPLIAALGVRGTYLFAGAGAILAVLVMLSIFGEARTRAMAEEASRESEPPIRAGASS